MVIDAQAYLASDLYSHRCNINRAIANILGVLGCKASDRLIALNTKQRGEDKHCGIDRICLILCVVVQRQWLL